MKKELTEMSLEELWQLFPIILTKPDKRWASWYKEEEKRILAIFSDTGVRINHIGSTAIHGIWAKPIIDILLELPNKDAMHRCKEDLVQLGYLCMNETEKRQSWNLGYTKEGFACKVFHLHLCLQGDNDELYFRDYMNEHPQIAISYEKLKLQLGKEFEHNRDGYTSAKSEFVSKYTKLAKIIYQGRYQ